MCTAPNKLEVRTFLNRLFSLPVCTQALMHALFDTFLSDTLRRMRAEGELDEGILDFCASTQWADCEPLLSSPLTPIAHHPQVATDAFTECGTLEVDKGLPFPCAQTLLATSLAHARAALEAQTRKEAWERRRLATERAARADARHRLSGTPPSLPLLCTEADWEPPTRPPAGPSSSRGRAFAGGAVELTHEDEEEDEGEEGMRLAREDLRSLAGARKKEKPEERMTRLCNLAAVRAVKGFSETTPPPAHPTAIPMPSIRSSPVG